jgi:glycosyltransferase involved in cell wall biosynthesis
MPHADNSPLVSIVILCCNQSAITRLCLESLARHTPEKHQLLLVDNGSTDETPSVLDAFARAGHAGLKELSILRNESNLGFAAGVNQALRRASGDFIVLLNNDTVLTPGWLAGLLGVALHVPHAGLIGPVSNEVPDPQRVIGLAEAYTVTGEERAFQEQLLVLQQQQDLQLDCELLQAKWHLARKEFEAARQLLQQVQAKHPSSLQPKILLSHVYLLEGSDMSSARTVLEEILVIDPENREARHNLEVLLQRHSP